MVKHPFIAPVKNKTATVQIVDVLTISILRFYLVYQLLIDLTTKVPATNS